MSDHPRTADILNEVKAGLARRADELVPWFLANMPGYYFRTHTRDEQVRHMQALLSGQVDTERQTLALHDSSRNIVTYLSPGGGVQTLEAVVSKAASESVENARLYCSRDGRLRLDTFVVSPQPLSGRDGPGFAEAVEAVRRQGGLPAGQKEAFEEFLASATGDCVAKFEAQRALRHFRAWRELDGRERTLVMLQPEPYPGVSRVLVAMNNPPGQGVLLEMVKVLRRNGVDVYRAYADVYRPLGAPFGVASFYVRFEGRPMDPESDLWRVLERELSLVKWYAPHELDRFADEHGWSLARTAFLQSACEFAHQFLLRSDPYAYTAHNVVHAVLDNPAAARAMLDWFEARFDPDLDAETRTARDRELREAARRACEQVAGDVARNVFQCIEVFISHTLRTNYYRSRRFGLSFRLDPAAVDHVPSRTGRPAQRGARPYGIYFFHGPHFLGFHVRYREMARGGVRLVPTRTQEQFELESNRLFDEVTALAKSQQHKNKDIPEGGSKAVLLLGPGADPDAAVRCMADSLLDIIVDGRAEGADGPTLPGVVDYVGREEIIYLGPDEHITSSHIEWIVARAGQRGYRFAPTFMSSKPRTGINHKVYGVTSLGVVVFAEEVLRRLLGIDPRAQRFSVKLTGGPRGDVAGNAVKILAREYGDNAVIVCMTDGHGAAWDPDGLDHAELLRLVDGNLGIAEFDKSKLRHKDAVVLSTADPGGARLRDSLHNTAKADLFIPAGGRPDTINADNWRQFLDAEGRPTARAIVEGANIFLSPEARAGLEGEGVIIVHGASANKTGVICSSYEILAGLVLTDDEFMAVKERYVAEVLDILGRRARDEARLLIREYKGRGRELPLTELTVRVSKEINTLADMIHERLGRDGGVDPSGDPAYRDLVLAYCPPTFAHDYAERIFSQVPRGHLLALLAAFAASRMVYAEGLGWLRHLADLEDVDTVLHAYLEQEKRLAGILVGLEGSQVADKDEIRRILSAAGRKVLTARALGVEDGD